MDSNAADAERPARSGNSRRTQPPRMPLILASLFAAACIATWATAMLLMRDRGFDITDEGYYVLSYRWWDTNLRAATGAQFVYGPLFDLLHHDIPALRLLRLFSVVVANGALGWTFARWLRGRRPHAPASTWWDVAVGLTVLAAGGVVFAWLPLSPGYNDATALGTVLGASLVLTIARDAGTSVARLAVWPGLALGSVSMALMLVKWTCVGAAAVLVGSAALIVFPRGARDVARLLVAVLAGFLAATLLVHLVVVRLDDAVPQIIEVNRLAGQGEHQIGSVLHTYVTSTGSLLRHAFHGHAPLFVTALLVSGSWRARWGTAGRATLVAVVVAAFANSTRVIVTDRGLHGGPESLDQFSAALLAMATTAALACAASVVRRGRSLQCSREGVARATVPTALLILPLIQAFGTNVSLTSMAQNAFGCWMALLLLIVTGVEREAALARGVATTALAGLLFVAATISFDGLLHHPYRTAGYADDTAVVPGDTPLGSLRLPPETAREYAALRSALVPLQRRQPEPIQAFDKMPGLILLLGGRPVGEAWTGPTATARSAAGLVDECRRGMLRRPPIILYNRVPYTSDVQALDTCGFRLYRDFRVLRVPDGPSGLTVYLPR